MWSTTPEWYAEDSPEAVVVFGILRSVPPAAAAGDDVDGVAAAAVAVAGVVYPAAAGVTFEEIS